MLPKNPRNAGFVGFVPIQLSGLRPELKFFYVDSKTNFSNL